MPVPSVKTSEGADTPAQATPAGRGIIDTRIGKPPVFSGDQSTWGDWSFKLRSYMSVVDLQLGRTMEAAELAAHASTWIPSQPLDHGRTAQVPARLVEKRTRTAYHPTTAKRSTGIPRSCWKVHSAFAGTCLDRSCMLISGSQLVLPIK